MAQRIAIALLLGLLATSCGKGPVDPSENITESFTGTVQPASFGEPPAHFTVSRLGEFRVSMTTLSPGNVAVGIAWGQWNGATCGLTGQTAAGYTGVLGRDVITGQIFIKSDYCFVVYDLGGASALTVAANYTVRVSHP